MQKDKTPPNLAGFWLDGFHLCGRANNLQKNGYIEDMVLGDS
jgi:hypothetical protein